jgi:hypothetical protein
VAAFVQASGRRVLSFTGYSGAGYEDPAAMRAHAGRILAAHAPASVMVNIGATAAGIGAVYALARQLGFTTLGIVSGRARDEGVALSPAVEHVFFVRDTGWGGLSADTGRLSPSSQAIVDHSSQLVGIGGGGIARDEMLAAQQRGTPVIFIPADMNHRLAIDKAARRQQPPPTDFRGAAHLVFAPGG